MTHKVLISNTTLKLFIPPQVWKMTPKLRQISGCELWIIPKNMDIGLNKFIPRIVIYLQKSLLEDIHSTVYLILQLINNTKKNCLEMVNFYVLLSDIHISTSPVFILNQIIWFISSVLWDLVINFLSTLLLMKY